MTIPAVVSILDLGTTATATSSMRLEASYTTASGNATTVQVALTQIMTSIFGGLPTGGGTGQILSKINGADYSTQWSDIASAVLGTTGITTSGSTTVTVLFADATPLSVLGVAGTATAAPLPIVASTGGLVLQSNAGGTGVLFDVLSASLLPTGGTALPLVAAGTGNPSSFAVLSVPGGGSGTTDLTAFGVVFSNGTSPLSATAAGTTAWALLGNGSALAPSFQQVSLTASVTGVLPLASGGWSTNTLTAFGVVYGSGTATPGITAAGTTAWPLVGNGTAMAPSFAVLTVPGGGTGTTTLTALGVVYGNGTSTPGITAAAATGAVLTSNGTAPLFAAPSVAYSVRGLRCANNTASSTTQLECNVAAVVLKGASGAWYFSNPLAVTNDVSVAGATTNGRDQAAAFSASSFVHFYFITKGDDVMTISSATSPPTGPTLPTGYLGWAYIGALRMNSASSLLSSRIRDKWVSYDTAVQVLSNGAATTEAAVSLAGVLPANAVQGRLSVVYLGGTSTGAGRVQDTAKLRVTSGVDYASWALDVTGAATTQMLFPVGDTVIPNVSQNIYYLHNPAANVPLLTLNITGYEMPSD